MSHSDTIHQQITCHNCDTKFVVALADAPLCPQCGAIHVGSDSKTKRKNADSNTFGIFAPRSYKIKQVDDGVAISWKIGNFDAMMILLVTVVGWLFMCGLLFYDAFNWNIEAFFKPENIFWHILFTLLALTILYFLIRSLINHEVLTITDIEIRDEIKPLSFPDHKQVIPIHIINEVFVKEDRSKNYQMGSISSFAYDVILATDDGDIKLVTIYDRKFSATVAYRIKSIAQIRIHADTISEKEKRGKAKLAIAKQHVNQPEALRSHVEDKSLTFKWKTENAIFARTATVLAIFSLAIVIYVFVALESLQIDKLTLIILMLIGTTLFLMAEYIVRNFIQGQSLTITFERIKITTNPFKLPQREIDATNIQQVFISREMHASGSTKYARITYRYHLKAISGDSPQPIEIVRLTDIQQALYLEQEIETFLGITDMPVAGEYKST